MAVLARMAAAWMPAFVKARACREVSADFTAILVGRLDARGEEGLDAVRAAARETGCRAADRLRKALGLGGTFAETELAWRIVSKAAGMKFSVKRHSGRAGGGDAGGARSEFRHRDCPMYSAGGRRLCENFCVPMVEGLTATLCPSCKIDLISLDNETRGCVKALVGKA